MSERWNKFYNDERTFHPAGYCNSNNIYLSYIPNIYGLNLRLITEYAVISLCLAKQMVIEILITLNTPLRPPSESLSIIINNCCPILV
jgi:hypothetical protein